MVVQRAILFFEYRRQLLQGTSDTITRLLCASEYLR